MSKKILRFDTPAEAQAAVHGMDCGKKVKHSVYRVEGDEVTPFWTVARNAAEARSNAALVLNITVVVEETIGLLEQLINLPAEDLEQLRELLLRNNLGAFLS